LVSILAYRSFALLVSLVRLPKSESASSKSSTTWPVSAASNTRERFFSVSPIHFESTRDKSI